MDLGQCIYLGGAFATFALIATDGDVPFTPRHRLIIAATAGALWPAWWPIAIVATLWMARR